MNTDTAADVAYVDENSDTIMGGADTDTRLHKKDPKTAVFDFFKMKSDYQKNIDAFKKLKKRVAGRRPKCVNCARYVGTNFTIKKDQYAAVCGDKTSPCKLNILITREPIYFYKDSIELFQKDIADEKTAIIQNKLNVIFGYITENAAISQTEKLLNDYNTDVMVITDYKEKLQNIVMSEERAQEIQKLQGEIEEHIREVQYLCSGRAEGAAARTQVPIEEVIQVYTHDLLPKLKKIRELKYPLLEMDGENYYRYDYMPEKEIISVKDVVVNWNTRG